MTHEVVFVGGPLDGAAREFDSVPEMIKAELAPAPPSGGPITERPPKEIVIRTVDYRRLQLQGENETHRLMVLVGMDLDAVLRSLINVYATRPKQMMPRGAAVMACGCKVH